MPANSTIVTGLTVVMVLFCAATGVAATEAEDVLATAQRSGGLVLHLGCGNGVLTEALYPRGGALVHGLEADAERVAEARQRVQAKGIYGPVTIEHWTDARLPHADALVNLVVVSDLQGIPMAEVMRVLSPGGVACIWEDGGWRRTVKAADPLRDEWTHFLHDPSGNATSSDRVVGPPGRIQWIAGPKWARSHEHQASVSAVVSARGRLFAIVDEGPTASVRLPSSWFLVARDAYSGVLLWKRPIANWEGQLRPFRSGPAELPRRLVAVGDSVFVTLGYGEPVVQLDAATGNLRHTYAQTEGTTEIICDGTTLYLVAGDIDAAAAAEAAKRRGAMPPPHGKRLQAVDVASGDRRWSKADAETAELMPLTLTVATDRVFFHNPTQLICLDAADGSVVWRAERALSRKRPAWSTPTVVVYEGVVLSADRAGPKTPAAGDDEAPVVDWIVSHRGGGNRGQLVAFDAATGKELWRAPCSEGYNAPVDVLVADGLVWTGQLIRAKQPGMTEGRDPHTGQVVRRRPSDQQFFTVGMAHHRCHRNRATERFLILGRAGVEFVDLQSGAALAHHWVRGTCQYGTLPANGLLYAPPHSCACYLDAKLTHFNALAPTRKKEAAQAASGPDLVRGPAYDVAAGVEDLAAGAVLDTHTDEWPTYRGDNARSGRTLSKLDLPLGEAWRASVGQSCSSPVVAGGRLFIADVGGCRVLAFDAATGALLWSHTAAGRIDSPPTVAGNYAVFGTRAGRVVCLDAGTGRLVWRFRAGLRDRRIVANEQLESAWPVHGSVVVQPSESDERLASVLFAAGRSTYLDAGIILYRLDLRTGNLLAQRRLDDRDPNSGAQPRGNVHGFGMEGVLPDVLSVMENAVCMRHKCFDPSSLADIESVRHLFCPTGFLDDSWWHRSYWLFGTRYVSGWGGWWQAGNQVPAGRLMVFDDSAVYGFGRSFMPSGNAGQWNAGEAYRLFATDRDFETLPGASRRRGRRAPKTSIVKTHWSKTVWLHPQAMVLAGDTLFLAGPAGDTRTSLDAFRGGEGIMLKAVDSADGSVVASFELDVMPVFDGMAVADGALYIAMSDGTIRCLRGDAARPLRVVASKPSADVLPPAPDPPPFKGPLPALPDTRTHPDFLHVKNARIGKAKAGYRIAADSGKTAVVLKELNKPLTGSVRLSVRMQAVPGYTTPDYYRNGFLAFGDAAQDDQLVKCGIKFIMKRSMVITGPTGGGKVLAEKTLSSHPNGEFTVEATVDVTGRTISVRVDGQTLTADLPPSIEQITHVGYTVLNGVTDVSPVSVDTQE